MSDGAPPPPAEPKRPMDPRTPAFVLCVCALLILVGTFTKSWASGGRGIGIGPTGVEACLSTICRDIPWRGVSTDVQLFATLSWLAGLAAAVASAAFGGLFLADKSHKLPAAKLGKIAFAFTAFVMTVFELRLLTGGNGGSPSWGVIPALGGVITASVMLHKLAPHLVRPAAVAVAPPPMPIAPTLPSGPQLQPPPSCPRCGTRLSFVADKQRWFCVREQEFV